MKRALAYLRVSTKAQALNGVGLHAQRAAIERFAKEAGYRIEKWATEIHSAVGPMGAISKRKELMTLIDEAKRRRLPIVVDQLDRLSRYTRDLEELIIREHFMVISAAEGERLDPVILATRSARAEFEARRISETTKAALDRKKQQGALLGNRKNLSEAQAKGRASRSRRASERVHELTPVIEELKRSGLTLKREIAEELNRRGYKTPQGKMYDQWNIRRLLKATEPQEISVAAERARNPNWGLF